MEKSLKKRCGICQIYLPIDEFGKDKSNKDGLCHCCKVCRATQQREYRKKNPEIIKKIREKRKPLQKEYNNRPEIKRKIADQFLRKSFNLSIDDYEKMLTLQNGVCYICKGEETSVRNSRLAVDHNHKTGKIRGLLCSNCNRALGLFKDDKKIILAAANYLEEKDET